MTRPDLDGIHHLKIPVSDLARSLPWYQQVLGLAVALEFPDADGVMRGVAGAVPGLGGTLLALREDPGAAAGVRGFDPVAFAVNGQDGLRAWTVHFDGHGIGHTPVLKATTGSLVAADDPDGMHVLFYSQDPPPNEG
jgi:catechol 2,3-dioxygenase-like lactoylglutathione lyase family enzyme